MTNTYRISTFFGKKAHLAVWAADLPSMRPGIQTGRRVPLCGRDLGISPWRYSAAIGKPLCIYCITAASDFYLEATS